MNTKIGETERLWKAWIVILEMLKDRKYTIPSDYFMSFEEFREWTGDADVDASYARKIMYYTIPRTENKSGIAVFWKELLGTSDVQHMIETMNSEELKHAIIIHNNKVTPYATMALRHLKVQKIIIEVFSENELQYNITKHDYVPRHVICSAETKQKVFGAYSVDSTKIVKIVSTDPVIRYLGATRGQLIKIIRLSDSIPSIILSSENGKNREKKLYDITYKIVG